MMQCLETKLVGRLKLDYVSFISLSMFEIILHQIFSLARDWFKRVTCPNIPQLKQRHIRVIFPSDILQSLKSLTLNLINVRMAEQSVSNRRRDKPARG